MLTSQSFQKTYQHKNTLSNISKSKKSHSKQNISVKNKFLYSPLPKLPTLNYAYSQIQTNNKSLVKTDRTNSFSFLYTSANSSGFNCYREKKKINSNENLFQLRSMTTRNPQNKLNETEINQNKHEQSKSMYKKINQINQKINFTKKLFTKTQVKPEKQNLASFKKQLKIIDSDIILKQSDTNRLSLQKDNKINDYTYHKQRYSNLQKKSPYLHKHLQKQQYKQKLQWNPLQDSLYRRLKKNINPIGINDFEIGKRLGKGNFGQVFVARNKQTNFICAIKIISKKKIKQEKIEDQITRQLKIHSFVKHINIIELYGYFHDENNLYILQQVCTDGQLYDMLKKKRRISQNQTAYIIRQILQAVWYLHLNKIFHRDIKPENILIQKGIVKICDFGWAVYSQNNLQKSFCGTPLYFSPELVKRESYNDKVDVWAIGMIAYQLLFGRVPFNVWCEQQLNNIIEKNVQFPDFVDVSQTTKDFILRMLEKNPQKRISILDLFKHDFLLLSHSARIC